MSKITRDEVGMMSISGIMKRIDQRDAEWEHTADLQKQTYDNEVALLKAQYGELVEAVSNAERLQYARPDVEKAMLALAAVFKANKKLTPPPPSPADRLDAIADNNAMRTEWHKGRQEIRAIAAELREGES